MTLPLEADPLPLKTDADGVARVGGTRVTLDTVVEAFSEGLTAEELQQQYPSLGLPAVYAAISYYLHHRQAVDAYLEERVRQAEAVRREVRSRFDQSGIRARLLARQRS